MFQRILIANRGEIACRVIRTCREMGIATTAVYSEADRDARHALAADSAVCIGPPEAAASYLDINAIVAAAKRVGAEAIHPGYGFLSENAEFAACCAEAGLTFIGPSPDVIRRMGSKIEAKAAAIKAGLPVVPGYSGKVQEDDLLAAEARRIGAPVMIKASAGGGGRGMRLVKDLSEFGDDLAAARAEALSAFGDGDILLERFIARSRHIEVQVLADRHGNVRHLGERDCSIQRNHQKIIEETPAPDFAPEIRERMVTDAVKLAGGIGYDSAGTVEFIYDTENGEYFFLEMNTRLQVEHPVTEMVTGHDLVAWQIRIAAGEEITFSQSEVRFDGAAMEARIAAEDPAQGYLPQTGEVTHYLEPTGEQIRVDSGLTEGMTVSPYYDSMLAKVIARGPDRPAAVRRLRRALNDYRIAGVGTNMAFISGVLDREEFNAGQIHTAFLDRHFPDGWRAPDKGTRDIAAAALAYYLSLSPDSQIPWQTLGAWRLTEPAGANGSTVLHVRHDDEADVEVRITGRAGNHEIVVGDEPALVLDAVELAGGVLTFTGADCRRDIPVHVDGDRVTLFLQTTTHDFNVHLPEQVLLGSNAGGQTDVDGQIRAPMPGLVTEVRVEAGDTVSAGGIVVIMEAMKLQQSLRSETGGQVGEVQCAAGDNVVGGALLVEFSPE